MHAEMYSAGAPLAAPLQWGYILAEMPLAFPPYKTGFPPRVACRV